MRSKAFIWAALLLAVLAVSAPAAVIDRVVAFVEDEPILQSELDQAYEAARTLEPSITMREVLRTLVNRKLLLREARKLFPETSDEDRLIRDYIDLKVRAFIRVSEEEARAFYEENRASMEGAAYEAVKDRIELLLEEREVNRRLASHIGDLQSKAEVRVLLED
jgi:hypothetical protein